MKTTVFVHMWNGVVNKVMAVGDGVIDVIVLNQDSEPQEPIFDEGNLFDYSHLTGEEGEFQKQAALKELEEAVQKVKDEDAELWEGLEEN